ncbi:MAG: prolyl oligopeptidase family serine peptidase, partial [Anaerolineae bacterium]
AFLTLTAAGSQGGHSIYVNGRRVANAPNRPGGQSCRVGTPAYAPFPTDSLPIPAQVLVQGENLITLTNDADVDDSWTAANLRLEIHGVLSGPPVAALTAGPPAPLRAIRATTETVSSTVWLTSTYELAQGETILQLAWYQIPMGYTDTVSVPLVIALHGMGYDGQSARDYLAAEANSRGWLLAAPDMHGRYLVNSGENALAYVGAQHDVMDTVAYMMSNYAVDPSHIYVAGGSMGGQTSAMMAAKYPDVFVAAVPWKPITDLSQWYDDLEALSYPPGMRQRISDETGGQPDSSDPQVIFEYRRRSPMEMPQNSRRIPIKMWHDVDDAMVFVEHSRNLRDAINSWNPLTPVTLIEIPWDENDCPPDGSGRESEHCYNPPPADVFDFLDNFTLDTSAPLSLTVRLDESKPYYWLNLAQTGGDHWTDIHATYTPASQTVTATVSDDQALTLAFNLGSTPSTDAWGLSRAGIGLPATTYLVRGGGNDRLEDYSSGYLSVTLTSTGLYTLTVSAIDAELGANPDLVSGWHTTTATITVTAQDRLGNPIPDGSNVQLVTTEGTWPNASPTFTIMSTGGQATTTLTLTPGSGSLAEIVASIESVTTTTSIDIIYPAIDLRVTPDQALVRGGDAVTLTYQLTNTGDTTLNTVTVTDNYGLVCAPLAMAADATHTCHRNLALSQTITITASVSGQDPLENDISDSDSTTINVISPMIDLLLTPYPSIVHQGEHVTFTYQVSNTGDATLTAVRISDNDGLVCENITLAASESHVCSRGLALSQTTSITATVTAQDPLGDDVTDSDAATAVALSPAIGLRLTPHQATVYPGEHVTLTYQVSNTGNATLTDVSVEDDQGTVCEGLILTAGAAQSCTRGLAPSQTTTITATAAGQDVLGLQVDAEDWATVNVISPAIALKITSHYTTVRNGEPFTFTYHVTNTGDATLTRVTVRDDDVTVCEDIVLAAGTAQSCTHSVALSQTTTHTASVSAQDPLGREVGDSDSITINVISPAMAIEIRPHQTIIDAGE